MAPEAKSFSSLFPSTSLKLIEVEPGLSVAVEDSLAADSSQPDDGITFLCLPGMGDVRQSYRFLAPLLIAKGHRVVAMDIRGAGDSSLGFNDYSPLAVSRDAAAVIRQLSPPPSPAGVVVLGNSFAGSSALHLSATATATASPPSSDSLPIKAVVGLAPVVRDLPADKWFRLFSHLLFMRPWGTSVWVSFFATLFTSQPPADLNDYKAALAHSFSRPGRMAAFGALVRGSKTPCFQEVGRVSVPVLLLHGEKDPDFKDVRAEGEEIKACLTSSPRVEVAVMPGLGHYPHVEDPSGTADVLFKFLQTL